MTPVSLTDESQQLKYTQNATCLRTSHSRTTYQKTPTYTKIWPTPQLPRVLARYTEDKNMTLRSRCQPTLWFVGWLLNIPETCECISRRKGDSNPGSSTLEADALTTRPTRRSNPPYGGVMFQTNKKRQRQSSASKVAMLVITKC